jgi:hypothetical protein
MAILAKGKPHSQKAAAALAHFAPVGWPRFRPLTSTMTVSNPTGPTNIHPHCAAG